ncbi:MAG: GNAT family N-acetyltransferase [Armatimonadota bacterium]|nr:GNAT family N-acetyltransferase [Armatimonadota bacterium]
MITLREATLADLDFIVEVDLKDEGVTVSHMAEAGREELAEHRRKIAAFLSDEDKAAWVYEDADTERLVGIILWRYRNRRLETFEGWSIFPELDVRLFPPDGAFGEIFQLWVDTAFRRRGLATSLKKQAESESLRRGVKLLYTHTEERNAHVIEMNRNLGYREVRRGPIWDEVVRVSLIKLLG